MAHRNLKREERNHIIILYHEGRNFSHIAEEMGISRNTVRRWVNRHKGEGHVNDHPRSRTSVSPIIRDDDLEQMLEKYKKAPFIPTRQIAEEFGCTMQTVRNALHRNRVHHGKPAQKQIEIEPHPLNEPHETEPETESCANLKEFIKEDLPDQNSVEATVPELYANHEVKEELALGPIVLQGSAPVGLLQRTCAVFNEEPDADTRVEEAVGNRSGEEKKWCPRGVVQDDRELNVLTDLMNKEEPETALSRAHDFIKSETINEDTIGGAGWSTESELYADHEVKEELVLGPTELLCPAPLHQNTAGLREQGADSGFTQGAAGAKQRSRNKMCCDIESAAHTCYVEDELCATVTRGVRRSNARADSLGDESFAKGDNLKLPMCIPTVNKLAWQSDFNKHTRWIPVGAKPYKCDVCSKEFTQMGYLKRHTRIHVGEKPYKCDVCSKEFTAKDDLKRHTHIHEGEKPYKCDVCSKEFRQKGILKKHMHIHMVEKPCKCDVCSKGFAEKRNLKSHTHMHVGAKPYYKCDVCCKEFRQKSDLKRHTRSHVGEKPSKCYVCSKEFSRKSYLKKHMYIHIGEKPFKCYVCGKEFTEKGKLKCHMHIHISHKPETL